MSVYDDGTDLGAQDEAPAVVVNAGLASAAAETGPDTGPEDED